MRIKTLIGVISRSVKKHGREKPLTLGHLLNLLETARQIEERDAEQRAAEDKSLLDEVLDPNN